MKKKLLTLVMVVALVSVLVAPTAALANTGTQSASTYSTAINIVDKVGTAAVTDITFPMGAPDAVISAPYNNVDTDTVPQVLSGTVSEPVVRLNNSSAAALTVTLQITDWGSVVVSERYELVTGGSTDVAVVDDVLSTDGTADSVATGFSIGAGATDDLYLEVTLGTTTGLSGTSTLTILGES